MLLEKYKYMLLDENMVETGVFVYECISDIGIQIRSTPEVGYDNQTSLIVKLGALISANAIRKSPFSHGNSNNFNGSFLRLSDGSPFFHENSNGPFLRLSDGSGWSFEKEQNKQLMKRLSIRKGNWQLRVLNLAGIALRRQPIDSHFVKEPTLYPQNEIIRCTHMTQASSGVKFYRVEGTEGWVFDKRHDHDMLEVLSEDPSVENGSVFSNGGLGTGWSPDFVRDIASAIKGVTELSCNEKNRVISFGSTDSHSLRINVYYTTRTIGTALSHPSQGETQFFRRNCTAVELTNIFKNHRAHTGKGYKRQRNDYSSFAPSETIHTPYGKGLLVDQERELRIDLLELDEEVNAISSKRKRILKRIRDADLERAKEAEDMGLKIDN